MHRWISNQFLDVHTHNALLAAKEVLAVQNIVLNRGEYYSIGSAPCSVGLHPWYLEDETLLERQLIDLEEIITNENVVLVGEIGLDKFVKTPMAIQEKWFERQIELACRVQKPIVIHCVKAFSDLIALKKRLNPNVAMIVHGFNQNAIILEQLLHHGFYISFGAALLNDQSNAQKALKSIPSTRFFLETDDQTHFSIVQIYEQAALLTQRPLSEIQENIQENWNSVTNILRK
jgi:TatD DNase family protein